jgi:hypothetical protein
MCLLLMLGVKLMTLSASRSFSGSGVCGLQSAGSVLPRRRVGVVRTLLIFSLLRTLRDLNVRLGGVGVGVVSRIEEVSLLESFGLGSRVPCTTLMVVLGGQWMGARDLAKVRVVIVLHVLV